MNSSMPLTSACSSRFSTGQLRHASLRLRALPASPLERAGDLEQALGRVGPAVQDHVLDALEQLGSGCRRRSRAGRR